MDDEIEDNIGDVKYTDSQKSVTTSNILSIDFTDSSSDKHNSSGKETYIIEIDSDDSDKALPLCEFRSVVNMDDQQAPPQKSFKETKVQCDTYFEDYKVRKTSITAHEIFTQTSKTIMELAETEAALIKSKCNGSLQTQTSLISITQNKTVQYTIEISELNKKINEAEIIDKKDRHKEPHYVTCNEILTTLEDASSRVKSPMSRTGTNKIDNSISSCEDVFRIIRNDESRGNLLSDELYEKPYIYCSDNEDSSQSNSEEDSLVNNHIKPTKNRENHSDSEVPTSVENDIKELYNKLSENIEVYSVTKPDEANLYQLGVLTPLTEESLKNESLIDITPSKNTFCDILSNNKEMLFQTAGLNVRVLPTREDKIETSETFKLPPINRNKSCPSSPHQSYVFSINTYNGLNKGDVLPCIVDDERNVLMSNWQTIENMASGESAFIKGIDITKTKASGHKICQSVHLPPIYVEGELKQKVKELNYTQKIHTNSYESQEVREPISIREKIKELKISNTNRRSHRTNTSICRASESRSISPASAASVEGNKLVDVAERGCEILCGEILKRLRSTKWLEMVETLNDLPRVMEKFWCVISETRIADLIRQIGIHIDSPRTQVACTACSTLSAILKHTNYTKKPDFYEAVTTLLIKTGSYSRPVRRAANFALDDIVCSVDINQAVIALCIHGVGHKNPLVRCSSARLLVVCAALAGGGRELLRTRPPTAASARRYALRALSTLLDDKNVDTRKYAERLYSMLRPLTNFTAFYLNDIEVDTAARQMKKYDQLLMCQASKDR